MFGTLKVAGTFFSFYSLGLQMSYLSELLDVDYLSKAVKKAARAVRKIKPDILIGTGISGTICATAVGQYAKLPVGILRKEGDNCHSSETFELPGHYKFPDSWFFIKEEK